MNKTISLAAGMAFLLSTAPVDAPPTLPKHLNDVQGLTRN